MLIVGSDRGDGLSILEIRVNDWKFQVIDR